MILIFVYVVLPDIISGISDKVDQGLAEQMYKSTLTQSAAAVTPVPSDSAVPAFVPSPGGTARADNFSAPLVARDCFADALSENPDIVGRINIDQLGISYLVVQSTDNSYYLKTGYNGKSSRSGAIFLDYRCNIKTQPLKGNYILYGHNMKSGAMFHKLMQYKDKDFFYANRVIRFDTLYSDYSWEIFSAYVTKTDFNYIRTSFYGDDDWLEFLSTIQQKSMFPTDTVLSADDVVLTLSTCTYEFDDARFVVQAKLIK